MKIQLERPADRHSPSLSEIFSWRCHMQPNEPSKPPPESPKHSNEPPAEHEQPDENIPGEQSRSRSNEGDPQNPPD